MSQKPLKLSVSSIPKYPLISPDESEELKKSEKTILEDFSSCFRISEILEDPPLDDCNRIF